MSNEKKESESKRSHDYFFKIIARFLVEPKTDNDDNKRREFIFNVILLGTLILTLSFLAFVVYFSLSNDYNGVSLTIVLLINLFFGSLLFLSRKGFYALAAYFLIGIYFVFNTYSIYVWGVDLPQSLLTYTLIIIISGILISSNFSLLMMGIISFVMLLIGYNQEIGIIAFESDWKKEDFIISDIVEYLITIFIIFVVSWLSNRKMEKSLKMANESERKLREERDNLEKIVQKRTEEIKRIQYEKSRKLFKMAEFGRLSSGLFHDLSNYLNFLSMSVERLEKGESKNFSEAKEDMARVNVALSKTSDFFEVMRQQIIFEGKEKAFSVNDEINSVVKMISYELKKNNVEIILDSKKEFFVFGSLVKFNQIIINLLINSIDAYRDVEVVGKKILISIDGDEKYTKIKIRDWGCGISENISEKIFNPFFTTKSDRGGTGIGLSTAREIIRKDFRGKIFLNNKVDKGVEFIIELNPNEIKTYAIKE